LQGAQPGEESPESWAEQQQQQADAQFEEQGPVFRYAVSLEICPQKNAVQQREEQDDDKNR